MKKLDPKAVWVFFFRALFSSLILFLFVFFWSAGIFIEQMASPAAIFLLAILILLIAIIIAWIYATLSYRFFLYELSNDSFKKEQGIIWKKYVSIPYERIQNVDIHRGVIARILGLSDLYIQTAGSSAVVYGRGRMAGIGAEGYLPGLDKQTAEVLREDLIKRAKNSKQGL